MKTTIALLLCVIALALPVHSARAEEIQSEKARAGIVSTVETEELSVENFLPEGVTLDNISPEDITPEIARAVIEGMFDHLRGKASFATLDMTIHRPDWQRTMTIDAWTKGISQSVFFITAPSKDNGNGTLKKGREMWMFNPKVNRVIKLPPSMMSQGWMGSDFSNNDIAKSDTLINDYDHTLESIETVDGFKVFTIKSIPQPAAPVVWGMQRIRVREDLIVMSQEFFDEDFELVKSMKTTEIRKTGDKLYPMVWRMQKADADDEYTQLNYKKLEFKADAPDNLFTLSNLKARRR